MKKYNIFELSVVKYNRGNDTYNYFICKHNPIFDVYVEIFTKEKMKIEDKSLVEPLSNYYSVLAVFNYKKRLPLMLNEKDLFEKYNDINDINLKLEADDLEENEIEELKNRGIFEKSRVYKKSNIN